MRWGDIRHRDGGLGTGFWVSAVMLPLVTTFGVLVIYRCFSITACWSF